MSFERKYKSPEDFQAAIDNYFADCEARNIFPDLAGMRLFIDISQDTEERYSKQKGYAEVLKKAQDRRESWLTRRVMSDNAKAVTGAIFALKQPKNGGWRDVQETSGAMNITVNLPGMNDGTFGK
jgi:hypothetical protein